MDHPRREDVVRAALDWCGTPFHNEARVKGHGVDCGQLLIAVYGECGFMPLDYEIEHYPPDFAMHRDREWYLEVVREFAKPIDPPPGPGDVVLYKMGRLYSHGGIVTEWPEIVHAWNPVGMVLRANAELMQELNLRDKLFFSPFTD